MRILIHIAISLLSVAVYGNIILENDYVRYEFAQANGGLVSMIDKTSLTEHIRAAADNAMLWGVELGDGTKYFSKNYPVSVLSSIAGEDGEKSLEMKWVVNPQISVRVKAALANNTGIAAFRIFADNNSQQPLYNVIFPYVNGFIIAGDYDVAWPSNNIGVLIKSAGTDGFFSTYPCGYGGIMQFGVMVKRDSSCGVYFAAEDPQGGYKTFGGIPGDYFSLKTLVENADVAGCDFDGRFPVRFGVFQGSWIDGCKIYRKFAVTAPWASKGRLSQRASMPQQFKDIGLWMRYGDTQVDPSKTTAENNAKLYNAETFFSGIPLGVDWYFWHNNQFDYDLPNYLPAKPGYAEVFADLVSRGWIVEPYINCRVITENNLGQYANLLATKRGGGYYQEFYAVNSYVVCPYTLGWQDKIAQICEDVFDIGANAIYLDQLSATQTPCYNTAHGHPTGGGGAWSAGYRNMLDKIRNDAHRNGREISISGEFTNEIHIAGQDAFLFWQMSVTGEAIPMFPMVYSGYTLMKGSNAAFTWADTAWRMYVGRPFLWGLQCGWMVPDDLLAAPSKGQYLRSIGLYRIMARQYLTYGELVDLLYGGDDITVQWQSQATLPAIQGAVWKSESGSIGILLTNFAGSSQSITFTIDTRKYFPEKVRKLDITQTTNRGTTFIRNEQNGSFNISRTIFSAGIDFLEIKPSRLDGDVEGDQKVNLTDMAVLAEQWQ